MLSLCQNPSQGQLGWRYIFVLRNLGNSLNQFLVLGKTFAFKTRIGSPPVIVGQIFKLLYLTGQ